MHDQVRRGIPSNTTSCEHKGLQLTAQLFISEEKFLIKEKHSSMQKMVLLMIIVYKEQQL